MTLEGRWPVHSARTSLPKRCLVSTPTNPVLIKVQLSFPGVTRRLGDPCSGAPFTTRRTFSLCTPVPVHERHNARGRCLSVCKSCRVGPSASQDLRYNVKVPRSIPTPVYRQDENNCNILCHTSHTLLGVSGNSLTIASSYVVLYILWTSHLQDK
jgi:hypothetical protein